MKSYKDSFYQHICNLQDEICNRLTILDGKETFLEDKWKRPGGGGGRTRIMTNGHVIEKGGVNISGVHGTLPPQMVEYLKVSNNQFFACGISIVLHPKNPFVPTVHANFRYFELYDGNKNVVDQWFAGGADMTPYYINEEDIKHFHLTWKEHCDTYDLDLYPTFKGACDEYFYNSHREEARGVGGIFFDYLRPTSTHSSDMWHQFTVDASHAFLTAYEPIAKRRQDLPYTEEQRDWQEIRRGRYVEFNLIHDKGTLFGLRTKGRIESILMSLPSHVQWKYDFHPEQGTEESKLLDVLKQPKNWIE